MTLKRPGGAPSRIPAWAWALDKWYARRPKARGRRPGPRRLPRWFWPWRAWVRAGRPKPPTPMRVKALEALRGKLGTKESPAGSNRCWATEWYGMNGQPWCAMSASWAYVTAGSKRFQRGAHYAYVPYIVRDARNRANGLTVTLSPLAGDLVCYDWQKDGEADHVGLFDAWVEPGKTFHAIEGNTAVGNDSNGGEVMRRLRDVADVQVFVRVVG